jgi:hypothetical protein
VRVFKNLPEPSRASSERNCEWQVREDGLYKLLPLENKLSSLQVPLVAGNETIPKIRLVNEH